METAIVYDEVFDAQEHYRLILDSMARPGKINTLPPLNINEPMDINNASALIAFALLNTDASFCAPEDETVANFIKLHTSAKVAEMENADLVFVSGLRDDDFISSLKAGTLPYPENSATVIADVTRISAAAMSNCLQLTLKGPGVKDTATVYVAGLSTVLLDDLKKQNLEFPLGIDLMLTDSHNQMICIPRSNHFSYTFI